MNLSGKECFKKTKNGTKCCAFANCTSDGRTLPKDTDVWFIPFPKTCVTYREEVINLALGKATECHHDTSKCHKCSRAKLWIQLCHRSDNGLQNLGDIGRNRYVCSKHFSSNDTIPWDEDPMPAYITKAKMQKYKRKRKQPKERAKTTKHEESATATTKAAETDPVLPVKKNLNQDMPTTEKLIRNQQPEQLNISTFAELKMKAGWACALRENYASFLHYDDANFSCLLEVRVWHSGEELTCQAFVLGAPLPQQCEWYDKQLQVKNFSDLHHFMEALKHGSMCKGIARLDLMKEYAKKTDVTGATLCPRTNSVRAVKCKIFSRGSKCIECLKYENILKAQTRRKMTKDKPNLIKCNNRYMTREQLQLKANMYRRRDIASTAKLKCLREKFQRMVTGGPSRENDKMGKLLREAKENIESQTPLGIFFEEQLKAASRQTCNGYRWNDDILKLCSYLYKLSPAAYRALRSSGYLLLPSHKKLRDYNNMLESEPVFLQLPVVIQVLPQDECL